MVRSSRPLVYGRTCRVRRHTGHAGIFWTSEFVLAARFGVSDMPPKGRGRGRGRASSRGRGAKAKAKPAEERAESPDPPDTSEPSDAIKACRHAPAKGGSVKVRFIKDTEVLWYVGVIEKVAAASRERGFPEPEELDEKYQQGGSSCEDWPPQAVWVKHPDEEDLTVCLWPDDTEVRARARNANCMRRSRLARAPSPGRLSLSRRPRTQAPARQMKRALGRIRGAAHPLRTRLRRRTAIPLIGRRHVRTDEAGRRRRVVSGTRGRVI